MSSTADNSPFAAFRVRSFRFQWGADLATSWAFEMETLIFGWYILVETRSVFLLTLFASLQYIGTLLAPMFGVMGHRIGEKRLLCTMRAFYSTLGTLVTVLAFAGLLNPVQVLIMATLMGLVRPSDIAVRFALIGNTMPAGQMMGAMSMSRTTQDSARIMGALTGAGMFAALGMVPALLAIALLYATSLVLTLRVSSRRPVGVAEKTAASPWRDLKDALNHVRHTPRLLGTMVLAFLFNVTAFSMVMGLLPYVAKDIYGTGQTGLGYLVASFAFGSVLGTVTLLKFGDRMPPGRTMLINCVLWHLAIGVFGQVSTLGTGIVVLILAGLAQSLCTIPLSVMLLRTTDDRFRGRVMGVRILAVYGLPVGLLIAGELVTLIGYPMTSTLYCVAGITCVLLVALRWRADLWKRDAPANLQIGRAHV